MKRLIEIQRKLKAPKGQYNSFGKYKYRSAEDILEALKPLLHEQGLLLTLTDDVTLIGDRYYIKATATITDGKDFSITNTALAREGESKSGMSSEQVSGSCSSYARKYALNGLFLIDDTKDADTDEYHKTTTQPSQWAKVTPQAEEADPFPVFADKLRQASSLKELQEAWAAMSPQAKSALASLKDERKAQLTH